MKKLFIMTALVLGIATISATPAFADRYWDDHDRRWRDRRHVVVEREYYHGPRYYNRPYYYSPYNNYVEPVYVQPAPVYYQPAPVVYRQAPVTRVNVRF